MNSLFLSGVNQFGNLISPIITNSNVLCANLYVERAQYVDGVIGNAIAGTTGTFSGLVQADQLESTTTTNPPLIIHSDIEVANLRSEFSDTANIALSLATSGSPVVVSAASPPIAGQVLIALSATSAEWGNAVVNTSNITVDNLVVKNSLTLNPGINAVLGDVEIGNLIVHDSFVIDNSNQVANLNAEFAGEAAALTTAMVMVGLMLRRPSIVVSSRHRFHGR